MKLLKIAASTLLALVSGAAFAELPVIQNAMINPTPPGAKVAAAYLTLHNPGDEVLTLNSVSSPVISRVEIHKTEIVDDIAKMRRQESVKVGSGESMKFTHGGLHVMLMDLEGPMMPGDTIELVFHTNHGNVSVDVPVLEQIEMPKDNHSMDHGESKEHGNDHKKEHKH